VIKVETIIWSVTLKLFQHSTGLHLYLITYFWGVVLN